MTVIFTSRRLIRLVAWLCYLPLLGSLASCGRAFLQGSFDAAKDNYKGPSYSSYDPLIHPGVNVGFLFGSAISQGTQGHNSRSSPYSAAPTTLLASTANLPDLTAPDPKLASFLSHVSFLYGPQLIGKGGQLKDRFGTSTSGRTYLEAIGYALYNYELPQGKGTIFGGLGPYLGVGLWGTNTYEQAKFATQSFGAFDSKNGGYSRFDAGLVFTAGYELPLGLRLSIAREQGLVNIDPAGNGDDKTFTGAWSLNAAYPLNQLVALVKKK